MYHILNHSKQNMINNQGLELKDSVRFEDSSDLDQDVLKIKHIICTLIF